MGIWETLATTLQKSVIAAALLTGTDIVVQLSGQSLPETFNAAATGALVLFVLKDFIQNLLNELDKSQPALGTAVGTPHVRMGDKSAPF